MEGVESRTEIARWAKVDRQTLCDWANRYNAEGPVGLNTKPGRGRPSRLNEAQRAEVGRWLEEGPETGVPAWTVGLTRGRIKEVVYIVMSGEAVRRLMRALGFRRLSPRPLHPRADPEAQEKFRSDFNTIAASSLPEGTDPARVDVWFQDEAHLWARRGF